MGAIFSTLFAKIAAVVSWVGSLWVAIFTAAYDLIKDGFSWLFDQVLQIATTAVSSIQVGPLTSLVSGVGTLPGEILNILGLLGVGTAIGIITAAIGIRLLMQLIPFVRLGS